MLEENLLFPHFNNNESNFTSWNLARQDLTIQDLEKLAEILAKNKFIIELDLSGNNLSGDRMLAFAEGLSKNRSLRVLKLNNAQLDNDDLTILISALTVSHLIVELSLASNRFNYTGTKLLINLQSLESLDLSSNNLGINTAKMMRYLKNLHTLNYSHNMILNAGIAFLMHKLELMRLNITHTGMSHVYTLSPNDSMVDLQATSYYEDDVGRLNAIIKINKANMIDRYKRFVNMITAFASHHFSHRSTDNGLLAFNNLPLEIQLKILNLTLPLRGKYHNYRLISQHIGVGPYRLTFLINNIFNSAKKIKDKRVQLAPIEPPKELIQSHSGNNQSFLPLRDITSQVDNTTINPALLKTTPPTPPRPIATVRERHNDMLELEQQGYENWQSFLEEAKDWNAYLEQRNNKKLLAPAATDSVANDEETLESDVDHINPNSTFADNLYSAREKFIRKAPKSPIKSPKKPVNSLFWLDTTKSPTNSPKRAATSLTTSTDSPSRYLKARTQ